MAFWKRNEPPQGQKNAPAGAGEEVRAGLARLPEAATIELLNQAELVRFAAGDDLLAATPALGEGFILLRSGGIRLRLATEQTEQVTCLEVDSALNLMGLAGAQLPRFSLSASADGALLWLSETRFNQLHEATRLQLLQLAQRSAGVHLIQLLEQVGRAQQRYARLSAALFTSTARAGEQFAASEPVRQIIGRIPRLPLSSVALLDRLQDEHSTHAQVAELVRQDPALTATLLKAINSSRYNFEQKITDLSHAVSLLGFEGVYQVIMAESLRKCLPDTEPFRASYHRALLISYLAFALAQASGQARAAEMATIALLHDVGRVVIELLQRRHPAFNAMIAQVHPGVVGAQLLKVWQLPEPVWRTIALQHYPHFVPPERLPADVRLRVALLHLSAWLLDFREQAEVEEPLFRQEYLALLGWPDMTAPQIWKQHLTPLLRQRRSALPRALQPLIDGA
jgi:HD-like signal output (HDOD) protein